MDTRIALGDVEFSEFEVPEKITLGGAQQLIIHKYPGGKRHVQAMGRDDDCIPWQGLMTGDSAIERARQLDLMRVQGKPLTLLFFDYSYTVVIKTFSYDLERFYRIPYRIELEVVEDKTLASGSTVSEDVDDSIRLDCSTCLGLGDQIGDSPLTSALSGMDSAIKSVSNFANAAQSTINGVLAPVSAVMQRVDTLIGSVGGTLANVTSLGGVLPNNPIAQNAARMLGQVNAATQLPQLYNLRSAAGRIQTNLNLVSSPPNAMQQVVGGGNLFDMASRQYGDPTKWTAIARANKLVDPKISQITTLTLPKDPADDGGIFTA